MPLVAIAFTGAAVCNASADLAPDSLSNTVVVLTITPLEVSARTTITQILRSDGRYYEVELPPTMSRAMFAGTYNYAKTSADTAELTLLPDGGTATLFTFQFEDEAIGTYVTGGAPELRTFQVKPLDSAWRVANTSNRGLSRPSAPCIAGFVVEGSSPRKVLLRAVGPSLVPFGVEDAALDTLLRVYRGDEVIAENDDWGTPSSPLFDEVDPAVDATGAFPLPEGSKDAALVLVVRPGAYTLHGIVSAAGEVLLEVYVVP